MPTDVAQVHRHSLEAQVFQILRQEILSGHLSGGSRLVQSEVAARFGVSRIPVRDAFRKLATLGLVETDDRGNCRVQVQSLLDLREVYEIRRRLEPLAAAKAVERLVPADLRQLELVVDRMEKASERMDVSDYVDLNTQFHAMIYELSGSRRLSQLIAVLWSGLPPLTPLSVTGQIAVSLRQHREMLTLLAARDAAGVERAVTEHITSSEEKLVATIADRLATSKSAA